MKALCLFFALLFCEWVSAFQAQKDGTEFSSSLVVDQLAFSSDPESVFSDPKQFSVLGSASNPAPSCAAIFDEYPFFPTDVYWMQPSADGESPFLHYCVKEQRIPGTREFPAASCLELAQYAYNLPSAVYFLKAMDGSVLEAYCDLETDGGGWALLFRVDQNESNTQKMGQLKYETEFASALWILGSLDRPLADPIAGVRAPPNNVSMTSHDWRQFLQVGKTYELRQRTDNHLTGHVYDVAFTFTYNGCVLQDSCPEDKRAWPLTNQKVLHSDFSAFKVDSGYPVYFFPPFSEPFLNSSESNFVYSACAGFDFDNSVCGRTVPLSNRYGNAGIITHAPTSIVESALPWFPHFNARSSYSVTYSHLVSELTFGGDFTTTGSYWVRPV
eukprot:GCRY01001939.1.p1 GENE.GCRY01001939.1~~GCRY01001939.1.p1  ORF type:complete len:442 (-),score=85.52 GCRY01001939.1:136-1293(-)